MRPTLRASNGRTRLVKEVRTAAIWAARRLRSCRGGARALANGLLRPFLIFLSSLLKEAEALDHSLSTILSALLRI